MGNRFSKVWPGSRMNPPLFSTRHARVLRSSWFYVFRKILKRALVKRCLLQGCLTAIVDYPTVGAHSNDVTAVAEWANDVAVRLAVGIRGHKKGGCGLWVVVK